jgi:hypothetical protein
MIFFFMHQAFALDIYAHQGTKAIRYLMKNVKSPKGLHTIPNEVSEKLIISKIGA